VAHHVVERRDGLDGVEELGSVYMAINGEATGERGSKGVVDT